MSISYFSYGTEVFYKKTKFVIDVQMTHNVRQLKNIETGQVLTICNEDLLDGYIKGDIQFVDINSKPINLKQSKVLSPLDMWPEKIQAEVKFRFDFVKEIQEQGIKTYTNASLTPLINYVIHHKYPDNEPPSWSTVNRWRKRFIDGSQDIRSLIPMIKKRGNRNKRIPDEVTRLCQKAINIEYMRLERGTVKATLERAITLIAQENENRPQFEALPLPTDKYINRLIHKIPAYDRDNARYGKQHADLKYRSVLKNNTAKERLDRAEIDHTCFDLFVVDENTFLPLGRPTLTLCIDLKTRCILGYYIGFYDTSFNIVSHCLRHAFLPKIGLKLEFPEINNDWIPFGIPREITVDNGMEFHSKSFESMCHSFNITIRYAGRKQGWFKGTVERALGTLTRQTAHTLPGTTFSNIFDKKDYDSYKKGVVTLKQLKLIITKWIVDIYHQDIHSSLNTSPIDAWLSDPDINQIPLPSDIDDLNSLMGVTENRALTHKGIEIFGMFYNSSDLTDLRRKYGEKLNVLIRYNPMDLGFIYVFKDTYSEPIKVRSLNFEYASGLTLYQHKICKKYSKKEMSRTDIESIAKAKVFIQDYIRKEMPGKRVRHKKRMQKFMVQAEDTRIKSSYASHMNKALPINQIFIPSASIRDKTDRSQIKAPLQRRKRSFLVELNNMSEEE